MTTYKVNEVFLTVQGEGNWTGRPAVFCRFSQCNLWSGDESTRSTAICTFCDTDFTAYEEFSLNQLIDEITMRWPETDSGQPMVVFTGGEPTLQLDYQLTDTLMRLGWYIAIETNGTLSINGPVDWVCVSPKTPLLRVRRGDELKLVYPQKRITPDKFAHLNFQHFWLSPMDGPNLADNTRAAFNYCLSNPQWRLNTQMHKTIGVR